MTRLGIGPLLAGLLVCFPGRPAAAAAAEPGGDAPDFKEVYEVVRAHLSGVSEAELNRAAVDAFLSALGPKVSLVKDPASEQSADKQPITKSSLFDGDIAYLRVGRVAEGLPKALRASYEDLGTTNKLKGAVLDLRFAGGDDYAAAAAVADLFLKKERPLLNWGNGLVKSREKNDAITVPIAILVNKKTSGAGEALAGILRESGTGLILGNNTAGQAMVAEEFSLKNGEKIRIATSPIQLADGSALPAQGIKPDIQVDVSLEQERVYFADPFLFLPRVEQMAGGVTNVAGTNRPSRRQRYNEAELVRERREGLGRDTEVPLTREKEAEKPVVHDPALARALDLLKGLAVVRQSHS